MRSNGKNFDHLKIGSSNGKSIMHLIRHFLFQSIFHVNHFTFAVFYVSKLHGMCRFDVPICCIMLQMVKHFFRLVVYSAVAVFQRQLVDIADFISFESTARQLKCIMCFNGCISDQNDSQTQKKTQVKPNRSMI